jgi:hypothetical protein
LKMGPIGFPETAVENYHSTLSNIPEERKSHLHSGGSPKSRTVPCCPQQIPWELAWDWTNISVVRYRSIVWSVSYISIVVIVTIIIIMSIILHGKFFRSW